ncbi:DNA cytosine methyltransferase [Saccharopolyspora shandongensis]|uniref:DNA cytosine methyltransferase n=1 Tax=Saccharopolyspora shandongensis TaxID=418495 RepID=UPI00343E654B
MTGRIGSLFSGYGGLDIGVQSVLGGRVAWHVDNDPGAAAILAHHHPNIPNLSDITRVGLNYTDDEWAEMKARADRDPEFEMPSPDWSVVAPVDVLTGGFPCQDVSLAGRRAGLAPDTRSGLWAHMAHAIAVLRPRLVVIENVRGLLSAAAATSGDLESCSWCVGDRPTGVLRALGAVLGELADLGYDAQWCGLRAADIGAPHSRFRVFVLAHRRAGAAADADDLGHQRSRNARRGRGGSAHHGVAAADSGSHRRNQGRPEPTRIGGGPGTAVGGGLDWGPYTAAIQRWEHRLGRPAPAPTQPGHRGGWQLAPRFVEWLMGLPEGHVTDVPGLTRNQQLRLLGNGVVPHQAAHALHQLLNTPRRTSRHG